MRINDFTNIEVNKDLLDAEVVNAYLRDLQVVLIQSYSWLLGYPDIVKKNTLANEDERTIEELKEDIEAGKEDGQDITLLERILAEKENLLKLEKEKGNVEKNIPDLEAKIEFFKKLI